MALSAAKVHEAQTNQIRASLPIANVITRVLIRSLCSTLKSEIMFREIEEANHPEVFEYWIDGVVKGEIEGVLGIGVEKSTLRSLGLNAQPNHSPGRLDLDGMLSKIHQSIAHELERQLTQDDFQCRLGPVTGVQHSFKFSPSGGPSLLFPVETKFGILRIFFSLEGSSNQILNELMRLGDEASERKVRVFTSQLESLSSHIRTLELLEIRLLAGAHIRTQMRTEIKKLKRVLHYMRCEPFEMVFMPARRLVTELTKEQGKRAKLVSHGTWLFLDKGLLGYLYDPILHLIRNAIDHGIEDPNERERLGKPSSGTIRVLAAFTASGLRMIVSDDGKGIDIPKIRNVALLKGHITKESSNDLMATDICNLIFEPGISTRDRADEISGRGLGLNNVQKLLAAIGGTIKLLSSSHQGTSFEITVPLNENLQLARLNKKVSGSAALAGDEEGSLLEDLHGYLNRLEKASLLLESERTPASAYECFRLTHSVRGVAGFLGWNRVVAFCHSLEDLLKQVADQKIALKSALLELLAESCTGLREFCDASAASSAYPLAHIRTLEAQILNQLWTLSHPNEKSQFFFGKYHLKAVHDLIAPASPQSALVAKPDSEFEKAIAQPLGAIVQFSGDRRGYAGILLSEDAFINVVHPFITGKVEKGTVVDKLWSLNEFARIVGSQLGALAEREGIELKPSAPIAYSGWGQPLKILGVPSYAYLCELNSHAFYLVGDFVLPPEAMERSVRLDNLGYHPPIVINESMKLCRDAFANLNLTVKFDEVSSQSDLIGFDGGLTALITLNGNPATVLFFSFEDSLSKNLLIEKTPNADSASDRLSQFATQISDSLTTAMASRDIKLTPSLPSIFLGQAYVANFNRLFLTNRLTGTTKHGRFELNVLVTQLQER